MTTSTSGERLKPYHQVRVTWWTNHDVDDLAAQLKSDFEVIRKSMPKPRGSLVGELQRVKFLVKADTLYVYLSSIRAIMFQKKAQPFTPKDEKLKEIIFKLYESNRPFPFFF